MKNILDNVFFVLMRYRLYYIFSAQWLHILHLDLLERSCLFFLY